MVSEIEQYWVNKDGENIGPFTHDQIQDLVDSKELASKDLVCAVGGTEWEEIDDLLGGSENFKNVDDDFEDNQRVIVKKSAGSSLNTVLTTILFFLLLGCGGIYIFIQSRMGDNTERTESASDVNEVLGDIQEIEKDALDSSLLLAENGLILSRDRKSPYSGWAKSYYSGSDSLSTLLKYDGGRANFAYSWKPDGKKCPDTALEDGNGLIVTYFKDGVKREVVYYKAGVLHGQRMRWHQNEQKLTEEFFVNGKLHGEFIKWDQKGQRLERIFYLSGLKNGPYSYWTPDGQKYEEGVHQDGRLDGKRIQWSMDGSDRTEEFYENGELISQAPAVTLPMDQEVEVSTDDPIYAKFLKLAEGDVQWIGKAKATSEVLNFVKERFEISNLSGAELFYNLAESLFKYSKQGGRKTGMVEGALGQIRNQWGISISMDENSFALSELPESVTFGSITWDKNEYANDFAGSLQGESLDIVVGDLQDLFSAIGLELDSESDSIRRVVEGKIWEELRERANATKLAGLTIRNQVLVFADMVEKKIKTIDPSGNSVFKNELVEKTLIFNQSIADQKIGNLITVLEQVGSEFEDMPSAQYSGRMIRKYTNLTIFSDKNEGLLYPGIAISILYPKVTSLDENTLIIATKVELGELLEEPVLDEENPKDFPF
jgi:antitoxin component YwqK of YwqJK toxin-antitoxin module